MLLNEGHIALVQCKGLRNIPAVETECTPVRRVVFSADLYESMSLSRIISASMERPGVFDDSFSFAVMDENSTNLMKSSVDAKSSNPA